MAKSNVLPKEQLEVGNVTRILILLVGYRLFRWLILQQTKYILTNFKNNEIGNVCSSISDEKHYVRLLKPILLFCLIKFCVETLPSVSAKLQETVEHHMIWTASNTNGI